MMAVSESGQKSFDIYRDGEFVFSFSFSKSIPEDIQRHMVKQFLELINRGERRCKDCKFYEAQKLNPSIGECKKIWEYAHYYDDFMRVLKGHHGIKSKLAEPRGTEEQASFDVSENFGCVEWLQKNT